MIEIRVNNSFSQIVGLNTKQYSEIRKLLSYTPDPKAAYFRGGFNYTKYLIDKKGNFPTGLLNKVINHVGGKQYTFLVKDLSKAPKASKLHSLRLGNITPYADQVNAAKRAVKRRRGTISMVTGYGKSITMALLINELQVKTLVIVPNLELKRQLSETFKRLFGTLKNITIENIDSTTLKNHKDYGCLIIDEVHHAAARTYHKLNKVAWGSIYYRFGFTATPWRNVDAEQILLESIAGQVIYKVSYKDAVKQGAIVPVEGYYYDLPKKPTEAYTWRQVYDELIIDNEHRNALIADLLLKLNEAGVSTLCLVKEIAHGNILRDMTGCPFANGQDEDSKLWITLFNRGECKVLIGTYGVLSEGVDTRPCEYVVIAGIGKAKSSFMQQVGRGVRKHLNKESCKVVLFRDRSHKFCLQHFNTQAKILKEEFGVEVLKLEV